MARPNHTGKSDAELMRFCARTARTLSTLSRRIAASTADVPKMAAEFDDLTARLNAALAELDKRHSAA